MSLINSFLLDSGNPARVDLTWAALPYAKTGAAVK
jgi:hypothetical protein